MVAVIAGMVSGLGGVGLIAVINTALGRGDSMLDMLCSMNRRRIKTRRLRNLSIMEILPSLKARGKTVHDP